MFDILGCFESYHPRKQLRLQLARIMFLNLLTLYALIFAQFMKIDSMNKDSARLKSILSTAEIINGTIPWNDSPTSTTPLPYDMFFENYISPYTEDYYSITAADIGGGYTATENGSPLALTDIRNKSGSSSGRVLDNIPVTSMSSGSGDGGFGAGGEWNASETCFRVVVECATMSSATTIPSLTDQMSTTVAVPALTTVMAALMTITSLLSSAAGGNATDSWLVEDEQEFPYANSTILIDLNATDYPEEWAQTATAGAETGFSRATVVDDDITTPKTASIPSTTTTTKTTDFYYEYTDGDYQEDDPGELHSTAHDDDGSGEELQFKRLSHLIPHLPPYRH